MDYITRTFEGNIDSVLEGERAVVARINTSGIDRLKTIIDPLGCDVSHFNKTRSVLWNHGLDPIRGTVPIGHGEARVRRTERDMIGKTRFRSDDFSAQLFEAYKEGALRGWSIKAGVHEASPPTREELRSRPELEGCETIYRKWDLIEFSATPTPGNSDCLTMLVSRGLITAPEGFVPSGTQTVNENGPPAVVPLVLETPIVRTAPYIESDGKLWTVYHASGERAIALPDPEMADECLRLLTVKPESKRSYYASEAAQVFAESRRMFAEVRTEVQEYIDLYRHGRV